MKNRFYFIILALHFLSFSAQEKDSILELDWVEVYATQNFKTGHTSRIYSLGLSHNPNALNLSEVLEKQAGINFKNYGNSMLSGISYRGLSSAYTSTYWEDIPLNSTMNGQLDFNTIPTLLFSEAELRTGAGASLLGNASMGGSLFLKSNAANQKHGIQAQLNQSLGSFGLQQSSLHTQWRDKHWQLSLKALYRSSHNDFRIPSIDGYRTQQNANAQSQHYLGNIGYQWNARQAVGFSFWINPNNREIPGTYYAPYSNQLQKDQHQRWALYYKEKHNKLQQKWQIAWSKERYEYFMDKEGKGSLSEVQNYYPQYQIETAIGQKFKILTRILGELSHAKGENIDHAKRQNLNLNSSFYTAWSEKWKTAISIQKGFSNVASIPFTFDAGIEFVWHAEHVFSANYSTSFRMPTLNDLYWNPGGNPHLESEKGWMAEWAYHSQFWNQKLMFDAQFYLGKVTQMIQWTPHSSGIWMPINIQNVKTYGLESSLIWKQTLQPFSLETKFHYRYTLSNSGAENANALYIPLHSLSLDLDIAFHNLKLNYTHAYFSKRWVSYKPEETLASQQQVELNCSYSTRFFKKKCAIMLGVKNLFDQEYQGVKGYYMPGRNFISQFQINF